MRTEPLSIPSELSIINEVLIKIGSSPVSSIDDGAGKKLSYMLEGAYETLLTRFTWGFAEKVSILSQIDTTGAEYEYYVQKYRYIYKLPDDCLMIRSFNDGSEDFTLFNGNLLASNMNKAILEYTAKPPKSLLPPYFVNALTSDLAYKTVLSITGVSATIEYKEISMLDTKNAKNIDSKQYKAKTLIKKSSFLNARGTFGSN